MKFENQYLTYEQYRLLGGKMEYMPFNLLEFEARKIIDGRTQQRLLKADKIPQEVELCVNKMINCIANYIAVEQNGQQNEQQNNGNVASENIDGYSISYITTDQILSNVQNIIKSKKMELENIMLDYLTGCIVNGEHIIYNGIRQC